MRPWPLLLLLLLLLLTCALPGGPTPAAAQADQQVFLPLVRTQLAQPFTASYLGGSGADSISAAAFASDGEILLAGTWPGYTPARLSPVTYPGGGAGAIVRLSRDGGAVSGMARLGDEIADMEQSAGWLVACGAFGVAVLRDDLGALRWSASPGAVSRCAIGADGDVAALVGATIYRYGPAGGAPASWAVSGTAVADLAIDSASGLVFATGYTQKASNLKVAYLRAYGPDGALRWTNYDATASAQLAAGLGADSEGRRVALGQDGMLYFAGFVDGGNAIYGRDPRAIGRTLGAEELISFDAYNTPYNISGAKALAWYGRFDPASGALKRGQWLLTRLNDGKGNSIAIKAIAAAADGTVLIGGEAYYALQGRSAMRLNGAALGGYEAGEPFTLVASPDLSTRQLWTALAATDTSAGGSPATAVAIDADRLLVGVSFSPRTSLPQRGLITARAIQAAPAGDKEGYLLLMARP
jgi:hypothetical protein